MQKEYIYPIEIRNFERELIEFIIETGKDKRSSDIESHILAYFFCHRTLTQNQIQELSGIFRTKIISKGSISNFLNLYEHYGVIEKKKIPEKNNAYEYTLKDPHLKGLLSTGLEAGLTEMTKWIEYINYKYRILKQIKPESDRIDLQRILLERLEELRNFLEFHNNLMRSFFSGKLNVKEGTEITVLEKQIEETKKINVEDIEKEILNFIQKSPLFLIDEGKYFPIYSYLIIRKRLTQLEIARLTGLSSGLISEGLNYLTQKGYIEVEKVKGIRKRFYIVPSIGYSNYLKQYLRFQKIMEYKNKIQNIFKELNNRKEELKNLNGYEVIFQWVKEALEVFAIVENGIKIFKEAINHFKTK